MPDIFDYFNPIASGPDVPAAMIRYMGFALLCYVLWYLYEHEIKKGHTHSIAHPAIVNPTKLEGGWLY